MKSIKLAVFSITIIGIFFCLSPLVMAAGSPAGGKICCLVQNPGGGALAFKGTLGMVYDTVALNTDVTLRLDRSGDQKFFRLNLTEITLWGLTDEEILCLIFNPNTDDRVADFVSSIKSYYNLPINTKFVITATSIDDYMGVYDCGEGTLTPFNCLIPDTNRASTLGDLIIYAVQPDKFNPVYPACLED